MSKESAAPEGAQGPEATIVESEKSIIDNANDFENFFQQKAAKVQEKYDAPDEDEIVDDEEEDPYYVNPDEADDEETEVEEEDDEVEEVEASEDEDEESDEESEPVDPFELLEEAGVDPVKDLKFEVKVRNPNGEQESYQLTPEELVQGFQKAHSADAAFQTAANMRKQAETVIQMLRDPSQIPTVLSKLGVNFDQLAAQHIEQAIRYETASPEEKKMMDAQRRLQEVEQREQMLRAQEEARREAELQRQFEDTNKPMVLNALDGVGLSRNKQHYIMVLEEMYKAAQVGYEMPPGEAARRVRTNLEENLKNYLGNVDEAALEQILGEEATKKVTGAKKKAITKKVRGKGKKKVPVRRKFEKKKATEAKGFDDYFDQFRGL